MNPPVVVWAAMIGACLAIAMLHLGIWLRGQVGTGRNFLLVGIMALAVAGIGGLEMRLMTLEFPGQGLALLRWAHALLWVMTVAMALLVHLQFGTGRLWLLVAALATRTAAVIVNFASDGNLYHLAETSLRTVPFLWGQVTLPDVVPNPWAPVGPFAALVLVAYVADASLRLWRRGDANQRRRAALIGGSIVLMVLFTLGAVILKESRVLPLPFILTPSFLLVVLAVGYELVTQVLRSSTLTEQLQASRVELQVSEQRLRMATQAAGV